jgi:hypothetical protein
LKSKISFVFLAALCVAVLTGCTDKINQTGSWLVGTDSTLVPRYFDSVQDSINLTTSQVTSVVTTGSSAQLSLGSVPWTEADLLLEFYGLDSVHYASIITSAQLILTRAPYVLQPQGEDVRNLQFVGYEMDSAWTTAYTWDSVAIAAHGTNNIVVGLPVIDSSTVTINLDTAVVRKWGTAAIDSTVKNHGFLLKPTNVSGILSVYSSVSSYHPEVVVACVINGVTDTIVSSSSYLLSVAHSTIAGSAPSGPFKIVQSGTGLREKLFFDLSRIPKYSVVNSAQLTVFADPIDSLYSGNSVDSLYAYYIVSSATDSVNALSPYLSALVGNKYTFKVTELVQQMLNAGNNGFLIRRFDEVGNVDVRFIYDETAPDSLKPRLTITYSPVIRKTSR